jgi:hypothetical protein
MIDEGIAIDYSNRLPQTLSESGCGLSSRLAAEPRLRKRGHKRKGGELRAPF